MTGSLVVLGQPTHRRTSALNAALARLGLPAVKAFDYAEVMAAPDAFVTAAACSGVVKIDSPGGGNAAHLALLSAGQAMLGLPTTDIEAIKSGELCDQHAWFSGLIGLLRRLDQALPGVRWLNSVNDIVLMCDKWACQQQMAAAGVATPVQLGLVQSLEQLLETMAAADCQRAFIKARFGSSAAGVVAFRCHRNGRMAAMTTAELVQAGGRWRLYNRLKPLHYELTTTIARLIEQLARQGAYAEAWVPKPRSSRSLSQHFDARVLASAGRARQRVARLASHPMTNLHLGNQRSDLESLIGETAMIRLEHDIAIAASVFANSLCIGFDVIPLRNRTVFLEANAFGDDVQGAHWEGLDPYDDQVRALWPEHHAPHPAAAVAYV